MQHTHSILTQPLAVSHNHGRLEVMKEIGKTQSEMGDALTLDSVVNSIDAELIATGPSGKGPNRGAIVRHGRYILWGFEGPVANMTEDGRRLFVNTICYAAGHGKSPVLEHLMNGTRDKLYGSLEFARRAPGYVNTIKRLYVPESLASATHAQIENWVSQNRPYLRVEGRRRFVVDEFARGLEIPNHTSAYLDRCVQCLEEGDNTERALNALHRYTGRSDLGSSASGWKQWLAENRPYLYFSDCDGFRFRIDAEAKAKGVPTAQLRRWSSESLDYRFYPDEKAAKAQKERPGQSR